MNTFRNFYEKKNDIFYPIKKKIIFIIFYIFHESNI